MKNIKKFTTLGLLLVFIISALNLIGCASKKESDKIVGSAGLIYELSDDGTYYIMVNGRECTEEDVVIGNWHEENGVSLPVKAIGAGAFTLHNGVTIDSIKSITVADGVKELLGEGSLHDLPKVQKIILPDGIESLGVAEFMLNFELKEVVIGKGLKTIQVDAFGGVPEDIVIYFRGTKEEWESVEIGESGNEVLSNCKIVFDYKD